MHSETGFFREIFIATLILSAMFSAGSALSLASGAAKNHGLADNSNLVGYHLLCVDNCGTAGQQKHILSGDAYRYPETVIPTTLIPAQSVARTVAFGQQVVLGYAGLNPQERYKLKLTFLSDSDNRQQKIMAGNELLIDKLKLPQAKVITKVIDVPPHAYKNGTLIMRIIQQDGPNAVVSCAELWSTDTQKDKITPITITYPPVEPPRYSPPPVVLNGVEDTIINLNGTWKFNPLPDIDFDSVDYAATASWSDIQVPGQWVEQGFTVKPNTYAGYFRQFTIPADWMGHRIKLRFDAVYSKAIVWVNGQKAGAHIGGFTPFELDITNLVKAGKNELVVAVCSESLADTLASGSQYATHQLGGIPRKVILFALPQLNIAALHINTLFDKEYNNATMDIAIKIANESKSDIDKANILFTLRDSRGNLVNISSAKLSLTDISQNSTITRNIKIPVSNPRHWDCEHPYLYELYCTVMSNNQPTETVKRSVGFREVKVRGNQLLVNGQPVKLRGVCRHETDPLRGRSLTDWQWRKDVELFRAANVNYIRTSHYPPAEEFLDYCDRMGMFVECEAPLCWVKHAANPVWSKGGWNYQDKKYYQPLAQANLEMIEFNRRHPCIIIWSLANESRWSRNFAQVLKLVHKTDSSRPTTFHDQSYGSYNNAGSKADIAVFHYPGANGASMAAKFKRPLLFGEYCHLNDYNRYELATDPGLRNDWGRPFARMWESMYKTRGCLGGAIWSGIDDTFFLPGCRTVGYGPWGPIDGWRRKKPEYWHIKKTYSPFHITRHTVMLSPDGHNLQIPLENRHDFTNINELKIVWSLGSQSGTTTANIAPHHSGVLNIFITSNNHLAGQKLSLKVYSPRGFLIDDYLLPVTCANNVASSAKITSNTTEDGTNHVQMSETRPATPASSTAAVAGNNHHIGLQRNAKTITITAGMFIYVLDARTGMIKQASYKGNSILIGGPELMILPLNGNGDTQMNKTACSPNYAAYTPVCSKWQAKSVRAIKHTQDNTVTVKIAGRYDQATGNYTLNIDNTGHLTVTWNFKVIRKVSPRQVGVVFYLPRQYSTLSWKRKAFWSVYPTNHIGRPQGTAHALAGTIACDIAGPRRRPNWGWYHDCNALGTNDFRCTHNHILQAKLTNKDHMGLEVNSDGSQYIRCWIDDKRIAALIANYSNDGAERFFHSHAKASYKPLKPGDIITDTIKLRMTEIGIIDKQ